MAHDLIRPAAGSPALAGALAVPATAADAGVAPRIGCHSWRARGITAYLENGGLLEHARAMAGHASARTAKLYDRRGEQVSLDEVERVAH